MWTRRKFLGAIAASGAATAVGPLLGCGAQSGQATHTTRSAIDDRQLTNALAILDGKLDRASLWSRKTETYELSLDHEEEQFTRGHEHLVVITAETAGRPWRVVLRNPGADDLLLAASSLAKHAIARPMKLAAPESHAWDATWARKHIDYRSPVRELFAEGRKHGGSRVIYRSAYLRSVHTETRIISRAQNLRGRAQRTLGGIVMGAWAGGEIATAHSEVSGQGGPGLLKLVPDAVEAVAEECLAHLHARSYPEGHQEVLLCPEAAALVAFEAVARSAAERPTTSETSALSIVDDPTRGYGAMPFDDEGTRAVSHELVGPNASSLPARGRMRMRADGALKRRPSHVVIERGVEDRDTLVQRIGTGVLLEGPELCHLGRLGERFALTCSRAREIRDGRFTGRLFARTITTARLSEFLSSTVALGVEGTTVAFEESGVGGSAQAPHWLTSAVVHQA